ncbi:hypothetical protein SteCoe_29596 [Stentor coeruleus]|uniref:GAF domain-containing protein n=1 Tax=Stentor coeruleus TaxID=5963 RepID=A0A1R2B5J7_9CILI|nr:hypothetical protein SteCoe_29596 [Stentor coeruleus]
MYIKTSTSEAFSDMIFGGCKSPCARSFFEKKIYDVKKTSSNRNSRSNNYRKQESSEQRISKEIDKSIDSMIISLMDENKKLKEELETMRKINKKLLESDKLSNEEYKTFYQTVFIDHLKKKVDNLDEEATFYRVENQKNSMELDLLRRDRKYIKAFAAKYRNLTIDKGNRDISPEKKARSSHFIKEKPNSLSIEKKFSCLNDFIIQLQSKTDFVEILNSIGDFLKSTLKAEKVSMILVSEEIKDLYGKHVKNFFRHNWNEMRVVLAEGPHLSPIELSSLYIEQVKAGFTTGREVYSTIMFNDQPGIYICLHRKAALKNEFTLYTAIDYTYLCLVSTCAGLGLNYIKSKQREAIKSEHVLEVSSLTSSIIYNKSHKELANNIYLHVTKFLEFESAGVVFYDQTQNELFIMIPTESFIEKFSDSNIKFPVDLGITGDVFKKNTVLKLDNIKSHKLFNQEIDNSCKTLIVQNGIFASLIGINGEVVGVLQVFNKKGGKNIKEKDVEIVKSLQKIIGVCISSTNCISEVSTLAIKFKQGVQKALKSITEIDKSKNDRDLFEIKNFLSSMRMNINDWNNQKKIKAFAFV